MVKGQSSKARLRVDKTMEKAHLGGHLSYPGTQGQLILGGISQEKVRLGFGLLYMSLVILIMKK